MTFSKRTLALSLCAATATSGVTAPDAFGVAEQAGAQVRVNRAAEAGESGYINGYIRPDGRAELTYTKPGAAALPHNVDFTLEATVGGSKGNPWGSSAVPSRSGTADIVTHTQTINGVTITRTFTIDGNRVEAKVHARNTSGATQDLTVCAKVQADSTDAYDVNAESPGAADGRWTRALEPGEEFEATSTVTVSITRDALDSDGDGLRDTWETKGLLLDDGTRLPINRWGADQNTPDLYLQLNWMKSEWETLGCDRKTRFEPTAEDFKKFAACATANTKSYAPDPAVLLELEQIFAEEGINLHIDAGDHYRSTTLANMSDAHSKGGKTEPYEAEYFKGLDNYGKARKLQDQAEHLLGNRKAVFRAGLIGSRFDNASRVSGLGQVSGSTFFVSSDVLSTDDQLRNTILHEFGHTLGLRHWGRETADNTAADLHYDYLKGYESVMSYAHQFGNRGLTSQRTMVDGEIIPGFSDKVNYTIPSDWNHLHLANGIIGSGVKASPDEPEDIVADVKFEKEDVSADDLVVAAAAQNNYKAGFRMARGSQNDNGIVTLSGNNVLQGELLNLGSEPDTFTVEADYGVGRFKNSYYMPGIQGKTLVRDVDIAISPSAFINTPVVPVEITVTNSKGNQVFKDTFKVSALDYTPEEARKVLQELRATNADPELIKFAEARLSGLKEPVVQQPKPAPATQVKETGEEKGSSSSEGPVSTWAIVLGSLLGVLGLGALGFGWAVNQGIIQLP